MEIETNFIFSVKSATTTQSVTVIRNLIKQLGYFVINADLNFAADVPWYNYAKRVCSKYFSDISRPV